MRAALWLVFAALVWAIGGCACAGVLSRADLEREFPAPFQLGEKDDRLPVWPVFKQNAMATELVAYVFESIDLARIPGFSGTPINLLVALAPDGTFLDVKVVSFHEPVFVDGLGPEPLFELVKQYRGKSLKQTLKVGPHHIVDPRRGVSPGEPASVMVKADGGLMADALSTAALLVGARGLLVGKDATVWRTPGFPVAG